MANHPNTESTTGTMVLEWFKINSRGCAGLFGTLFVPCRVSNVRRMSPRRASVRPKAFKCIHPQTSLAYFVCSGVRFGSSAWKRRAAPTTWRSMRCEVTMSRSHTFDTLRNIYVHRHHPRLSLVGELRAACLDGHSSLQGDTSGAPWSVGCVAEHGARSSLDLKGDLVADRLTLYTCVSEYRTCVSSHRVQRHASVPSAEPKKKKEKAESLVVVVSSSLPRSPNLPPPAPRVAP